MEHAPESWIDQKVQVKKFGDKEPLIGQLTEATARGVVVEVDNDTDKDYPDAESLDVLAFVPMNKVTAILRYK